MALILLWLLGVPGLIIVLLFLLGVGHWAGPMWSLEGPADGRALPVCRLARTRPSLNGFGRPPAAGTEAGPP
jgi:hypothetical protein